MHKKTTTNKQGETNTQTKKTQFHSIKGIDPGQCVSVHLRSCSSLTILRQPAPISVTNQLNERVFELQVETLNLVATNVNHVQIDQWLVWRCMAEYGINWTSYSLYDLFLFCLFLINKKMFAKIYFYIKKRLCCLCLPHLADMVITQIL